MTWDEEDSWKDIEVKWIYMKLVGKSCTFLMWEHFMLSHFSPSAFLVIKEIWGSSVEVSNISLYAGMFRLKLSVLIYLINNLNVILVYAVSFIVSPAIFVRICPKDSTSFAKIKLNYSLQLSIFWSIICFEKTNIDFCGRLSIPVTVALRAGFSHLVWVIQV